MPELAPILRTIISGALQYILGLQTSSSIQSIANALQGLYSAIQFMAGMMADVFVNAKQGETRSFAKSTDAGQQIAKLGSDIKEITQHTYDVVIPGSLSWLYGHVEQKDLVPIRHRLDGVETAVRLLGNWRHIIDNWRNSYVDPLLHGWQQFIHWWDQNFSVPAGMLIEWVNHPAEFGKWAAAPLIGPIIGYLSLPEHKQSRDNLSQLMVKAWSELPEDTLDDLELWLVTDRG